MPAATIRSSSSGASKTGSTFTIPTPAGCVNGDLLWAAQLNNRGSSPPSPPTGWTQVEVISGAGFASTLTTYYKIASGEGANITFNNVNGLDSSQVQVLCIYGFDSGAPFDSAAANSGNSTTADSGSYTTGNNNSLTLCAFGVESNNAMTPDGGLTDLGEIGGFADTTRLNCGWAVEGSGSHSGHTCSVSSGKWMATVDGVKAGAGPEDPPLPTHSQRIDVKPPPPTSHWQQQRQTRWPYPIEYIPDRPLPLPRSQRIDVKPDQNYRWWQQTRLQPIPVTHLPPPPLINPQRSQRIDVKTDQNYRWWQQKVLAPLPSSFMISGVGGYGLVNVIINSSGVGGYRIANDIAGYNVYIGEDDLPDLEAAPAAFTQTLPFNYALTPPLSGTRTFYVLVRNQDHYGLESQNQFYTTISINSNGDLLMSPIGNPSGLQLFELLLNKVRVMALYGAAQDDEFPATSWKIWAGTSPPDVDIDTPVLITAVTGKIMATEIGPFSPGLLYVTVALYRASDDSLSTPLEGSITLLDDPNEPTAVFSGFDLP